MTTKKELDFKITSMMADLLTDSEEVKFFHRLQKMKESLKEMK